MTCPGSHSQWVVEKVSNLGPFVCKKKNPCILLLPTLLNFPSVGGTE